MAVMLVATMALGMPAYAAESGAQNSASEGTQAVVSESEQSAAMEGEQTANEQSDQAADATNEQTASDREYIEEKLNLANNADQEWSYNESADAWVMSVVTAVAYPELEGQQGVSVCVPGAYVKGIDTDGDGIADIVASLESEDAADVQVYAEAVKGRLVIDYDAQIVSPNGQTYTAATAPIILNTGAAGYGSSNNSKAATTYAANGYINVSCGNRGKQDTATDADGNTYYTGDAPLCLVDQKNAARFIKYNVLLGNLPGCIDYLVTTGGSGGGAHATMFAATGDAEDFYDYEIESGAVGIYRNEDGSYANAVTIDGTEYEISDGAWGCVAYSAITSLAEGDMSMAFEYYMDTTYDFNSPFQKQVAAYLSEEYMAYINGQNLSVQESQVGFDLNADGDMDDTVALTIEYDAEKYADTNGYGGTYLDLYLAEFTQNLQWYLDNLDYAEGWTWFDDNGRALSDEEVAQMTSEDKAEAFIEGRYAAKSQGGSAGGPGGTPPQGDPGASGDGESAGEAAPDAADNTGAAEAAPDAIPGEANAEGASEGGEAASETAIANAEVAANSTGDTMTVGTPDAGTTQGTGSTVDSANYVTFDEMVASYKEDIEEVESGDRYGNNQVELYNPLNYIGAEGTSGPQWIRIMMGAAEGDMSMFASLNLQIAFLNAGTDADIEWQWNGGHVPSEILGSSFAYYVDKMYGEYVSGVEAVKEEAAPLTANGDAEEPTGDDLTAWVDYEDINNVSFSLADAAKYRTDNASKAVPGFDVIDYGQEDYVFGDSTRDARHWDRSVLAVFEEHADTLAELFNAAE